MCKGDAFLPSVLFLTTDMHAQPDAVQHFVGVWLRPVLLTAC